jgi:hypothetical protein
MFSGSAARKLVRRFMVLLSPGFLKSNVSCLDIEWIDEFGHIMTNFARIERLFRIIKGRTVNLFG